MQQHLIQPPIAPFRPLTKEDVADHLRVTVRCVETWVEEGKIPSWRKIGTRCYWHPDVFFGWLAEYLKSDAPELVELPPKPPKATRSKKWEAAGGGVHTLNAGRLARIAAEASKLAPPRAGSA